MTKSEIRKDIKTRIASISGAELKAESQTICQKIISSQDFVSCTALLAYMPLSDEVDITPVISSALNQKKLVFLPRITPQTSQMEFYRFDKTTHTAPGSFGITEPEANNSQSFTTWLSQFADKQTQNEKVLVLVPGRAFTKDGRRLGRGKGFYDIYFSQINKDFSNSPEIKKSGVCFACQILADIPTTPDDVIMDSIFGE